MNNPKIIIKHNKKVSELEPDEEIIIYPIKEGVWVEEIVKIGGSDSE